MVKGQGHTKIKYVHNILSHNDTPICQKISMPMSFCQTQIYGENIILILRSKSYRGHECTRHVVPWWNTHVPNKVWLCQRTKKLRQNKLNTKLCHKSYKFDLKVKVQGRIWIMNVCDTSSYGDTPLYAKYGKNFVHWGILSGLLWINNDKRVGFSVSSSFM